MGKLAGAILPYSQNRLRGKGPKNTTKEDDARKDIKNKAQTKQESQEGRELSAKTSRTESENNSATSRCR
jgi:hypothetical protein